MKGEKVVNCRCVESVFDKLSCDQHVPLNWWQTELVERKSDFLPLKLSIMMGYGFAAHFLCAVLLFVALDGTLGRRPQNFNSRIGQGPPLPIPRYVPPFSGPPGTRDPSTLDPYACLPRYLCVVQNKKGEKRTTIVHGLHPALRKSKPNVIDPSTLPKVTGGSQSVPQPFISGSNSGTSEEDGIYRDREFSDSFLQQQEKAEAMAFLEEKRRQFLYQQGLPKSKIITKGGQKRPVQDEEKDSNEDEEAEKSQEVSKEEEEKEGEAGKSVEASKEEKEETDKSVEVSKEEKEEESDKSVELSKEEEKEEQEEESAEEDGSSENGNSRSKLSKYKIKKSNSKKRKASLKARMDDYDDSDSGEDRLATVPWNDTDPLKPSEIYDKLFKNVLPSFQLPSLKKVARKIPGMSLFTSGSDEVTTTTTTTTQRPGLFKRMLNKVTGKGAATPAPTIRRRNGSPFRRYKRDTSEKLRLISDDEKIVKQIKDPEKQCRMIYKGCDLPYDHIMRMVSRGQVLIENDYTVTTTAKPAVVHPSFSQDDEADQAVKDKVGYLKKASKPIPQLLAHSSLGGKKKTAKPGGKPFFGKNKQKPMLVGSSEESAEPNPFIPNNPKKAIPSLPLIPMKYQWGKPTYKFNGKPNGVSDFSGGITERVPYKAPPTTTTTSTTPRPIFAKVKLDFRDNLTTPQLQHSVIKVNRTHAVHVLSKKPYNPPKTRTRDAKGQPVSFNSVFTEIAGATGGIHDFFDRISGAFGGDGTESGRDFASTFPGSNKDIHGNTELFPITPTKKKNQPPPLPPLPSSPPQPPLKSEDGDSDERDDEDSASEEEDQEENKETGNESGNAEDQDEEDEAEADDKNNKNPRDKEEDDQDQNQEESEEEGENDEGELDIADDVPPHIRQQMIEDYNRKKHEQEQQNGGGRPDGPGGPGGPEGPPPPPRGGSRPGLRLPHKNNGRPGQRPPPKGPPPKRGGGFLSSLFS